MLNIFNKPEQVMSLAEAADKMNISQSSLSRLIKDRPEFAEKYVYKAHYQGRKRTVIEAAALLTT